MSEPRSASNYNGKAGKTNIIPQGQTKGEYGSNCDMKVRAPAPTPEKA